MLNYGITGLYAHLLDIFCYSTLITDVEKISKLSEDCEHCRLPELGLCTMHVGCGMNDNVMMS